MLNPSEKISCLTEDLNDRELAGFAGFQSTTHAKNPFPTQFLRGKQEPRKYRMFILESVKEMLDSPRKLYVIDFLT